MPKRGLSLQRRSLSQRVLGALLALGALGCPEPSTPYPGHDQVLEQSADYEVFEASRLRREARASGDTERIFVAALASYLADPLLHQDQFVEAFPAREVMTIVFERVEKPGLTPSFLYSIVELGRIALDGHEGARAKLQESLIYAAPPVTTALCDGWLQLLDVHTVATLESLAGLLPDRREPVYACADDAKGREQALAEDVHRHRHSAPDVAAVLAARLEDASQEDAS